MIIQTSPHINQAAQPDRRAHGAAPAIAGAAPVAAPNPAPASQAQPTPVELKAAVAAINQVVQQTNQNLEFSVDNDTHQTVVKMVDTSTGELIRQFPTEAALDIARSIEQFQQGQLFAEKA